jgi:hypothetical protein
MLTPGALPPTWSAAAEVLRERDLTSSQGAPAAMFKVPQMTFDRARARVVMLYEGGVWEFDGSSWNRTASLPGNWGACNAGTSVAYDSARHVTVAFGCVVPGETWEWNGASWQGPFIGPYNDAVVRQDIYDPLRPVVDPWSGTVQISFNHPNAAAYVESLGGVTMVDAGGSLRTWDGSHWKLGAKLPHGYDCNASTKIWTGGWDGYPDRGIFWANSRQFAGLVGMPTCFFPPLVEDSSSGRLLAFRDGPRGMLELDLTAAASAAAWKSTVIGTGGGYGLSAFDVAADAVYPHPYELWSPEHIQVGAMADPASEVFTATGTPPVLPRDKYRVLDWYTYNLFWPFRLLRDPDTGRVRVLTHRGAVWELGSERLAKLGDPCQAAADCGEGTCTVEKVCCDYWECGSVHCTTCLGSNPGHCGAVPAGQPDPHGLCSGAGTECESRCSGDYVESVNGYPCKYDATRSCGAATSCADAVLTPGGHCSSTHAACITANTNLPDCPIVNGQPVLTSECRVPATPCPGNLKCADAGHCRTAAETGGGCNSTADCTAGAVCNTTTHTCIVGGCMTTADCAPNAAYCDPTTHLCLAGGCTTTADCAPNAAYCNPTTHLCLAGGCTTRNNCASKFDDCPVSTHVCTPDRASVLASQLGIHPSTYQPPHRRTRQEIAALLVAQGFPVDDHGVVAHPGLDLGGYGLGFDPNHRSPRQGLNACLDRIHVCLMPLDGTKSDGVDACVAGLPRCLTDTPWDGNDPGGEDCCPEICIERYLSARQSGTVSVANIFARSGCYPDVPATNQ